MNICQTYSDISAQYLCPPRPLVCLHLLLPAEVQPLPPELDKRSNLCSTLMFFSLNSDVCACACAHALPCPDWFLSGYKRDLSLVWYTDLCAVVFKDLIHGAHCICPLMSHSRPSVPGCDSWNDRSASGRHKGPVRRGPGTHTHTHTDSTDKNNPIPFFSFVTLRIVKSKTTCALILVFTPLFLSVEILLNVLLNQDCFVDQT